MCLEPIIGSAQNDCDISRPSTNAQSFCALLRIIGSSISLVMTRHGCRKCKYRFLMSPDPFLEENFNSIFGSPKKSLEKMIPSERASQEVQNGENFSFVAPSSEE